MDSARMFEANMCIMFLLCPFGANTLQYIKKNDATGSIKSSVIRIPRSLDSVHIPLVGICMLL